MIPSLRRTIHSALFGALLALPVAGGPASTVLHYDKPAEDWEKHALPIGNGSLGAMLFGGVDEDVGQFTVDSLWTGNENPGGAYKNQSAKPGESNFGSFQNFGELRFTNHNTEGTPENYRRELDLARAVHTTTWRRGGIAHTREAIVSHPGQVLAWRIRADKPGQISGTLAITGAHPEEDKFDLIGGKTLRLQGAFANGLRYEAQAAILTEGGKLTAADGKLHVEGCDSITVLLAADTNYVMDRAAGWMQGDPADKVASRLASAAKNGWPSLLEKHVADHAALFNRVRIDLGASAPDVAALPTHGRIARYREQALELPRPCLDPELEALLFQYGRYLLIASSRPGTLPANLQGIWNNSNKPAWFADYHTNINIQMNYWLAETTNLSELTEPLFSMLKAGAPVYREGTAKEYGENTRGFVTRMSLNPYGGGGWKWNIESTAWLAQHFWEHFAFSNDKAFLRESAWPWLREVSYFWLGRLKELPDGRLVVPNAWSHEHGPHEDGTAHAQQLMWDLFTNTLEASKLLGEDPDFQQKLTDARKRLAGPKIGTWGQLMEWMEEKPDLEKGGHRHTSHLFGVHPGKQITLSATPELAEAARMSLEKRGEIGDSRRSWTWAWRTALWSRLGQPERAHGCVAGLLAHNTLDNLWATHPPFQIDGNLGITAGMAEIFLHSHAGEISLLPALPKAWPTGSVTGLRARGEVIVDLEWRDGKLTTATLVSSSDQTVRVRIPGEPETREVKLVKGKPVVLRSKPIP
jgi:alpha-L-fucosidase 2